MNFIIARSVLEKRSGKMFDVLILLAISIFSFLLSFKAGERGFFAFDQSIVFDGSYRVLSGQIPYRDFIMPVGPMVFWLQAIFFKFFGTNYFSYILGAAFINVLATICSVVVIRILFPSYKFLSYIAGVLTAIWFYPPFGTPWTDQTAFFFSLLAITVILFAQFYKKGYSVTNSLFLLLSGCFALLSLLSKQNAGVYILPLYFLLLIAAYLPDLRLTLYSCMVFSTGFIISSLAFFLWLLLKSDLKIFLKYFFQIPSLLGAYRISECKADLLKILFGGNCHYVHLHSLPTSIRLIFLFAFLMSTFMFILYVRNYKNARDIWIRQFLSSILCIYVIFFQYLFIHTAMNQAVNGISFIGIIFAISLGLVFHLSKVNSFSRHPVFPESRFFNKNISKLVLIIGISLAFFYVSILGVKISLSRKVQEFSGSKFPKYFTIEKLKALRWGQPTKVWGSDIKEDDIVNLIGYLKLKNKIFFIFPNFTLFYALLNVPSPQPILWFHKGLTYHVLYDASLDKWIVDDLKKNKVEIMIIEKKPPYYHNTLDDFPQLTSYISESFIETKQIAIFNIYEKKG